MSLIQEYLEKIKSAVYGKDVRQAIHDAIRQCYDDGRAGAIDLQAREEVTGIKKEIAVERERIDKLEKTGGGSTAISDEITIYASDYISDGVLDMSDVPIDSNSIVRFSSSSYTLKGGTIENLENVIFDVRGASLELEDFFINILNCKNMAILGGTFDGASKVCIYVLNTPHFTIDSASIKNTGSANIDDCAAIQIFGDSDNFKISNCMINGVNAGSISDDGFIHAYGIFVNRLDSNQSFPRNGIIERCTIKNVAGTDTSSVKADGDGIFIQAPPYLTENGEIEWRRDTHISIENCIITDCKKRGIKCSAPGVRVSNTTVDGEFWYAGIDAQYGHMIVENSTVINTSDYTDSITSAIIANEGGLTVKDSIIKAPYGSGYHDGIRMDSRLQANVVPSDTPWDDICIDNCFFDEVLCAVRAYSNNAQAESIKGVYITNCRVGKFRNNNTFVLSSTLFESVKTLVLTDWKFDYGTNRTDIKSVLSTFTYPIMFDFDPSVCCEIHSNGWNSEPRSGALPTSPGGYIEYNGNISGIMYKKYTSYHSEIVGTKNPAEVTATLALQLLYNSQIGDKYTNKANGTVWICTKAGTDSTVGTWQEIGYAGTSTTADDGNGVEY